MTMPVKSWDDYISGSPAGAAQEAVVDVSAMAADNESSAVASSQPAENDGDAVADTALLGERCEGVPLDVHRRMIQLVRDGRLPITSPAQRSRQRATAGSGYGVPQPLREALRFSYRSPNLEAPRGLVWRCRGKVWVLCPRGG